jgi:hypothetical protein
MRYFTERYGVIGPCDSISALVIGRFRRPMKIFETL